MLEADDVFHDISAGIVRPALATVSEPRKLRHKAKQVHHERVQLLMLCLNQFIMRAHLDDRLQLILQIHAHTMSWLKLMLLM